MFGTGETPHPRPESAGPVLDASNGSMPAETPVAFAGASELSPDLQYFQSHLPSAVDAEPFAIAAANETSSTTVGEATNEVNDAQVHEAAAAVHGLFDAPDDELRIALLRGELRLALDMVPEAPSLKEITSYPECSLEYEVLKSRAETAKGELARVTGEALVEEGVNGKFHTSWHYIERTLDDGTVVPQAYEVRVHYGARGQVQDTGHGLAAIRMSRVVLHEPMRDLGRRNGQQAHVGFFDADTRQLEINQRHLVGRSFGDLSEAIAHSIRLAARKQAVAPWAADFARLPSATSAVEEVDGVVPGQSLRALIQATPHDYNDSMATLAWIFNAGTFGEVGALLEQPLPGLMDELRAQGTAPRYEWFMKNAAAMQTGVRNVERLALEENFRPRFKAWCRVQEINVARLETLVDELQRTVNITHNRPSLLGPPQTRRNQEAATVGLPQAGRLRDRVLRELRRLVA